MIEKKHYSVPTHLNKEPFLSVWWMEDPTNTICYIQASEDMQQPMWIRYGDTVEMLSRHITDFENTILKDIVIALKCHEPISSEIIRKHIIR